MNIRQQLGAFHGTHAKTRLRIALTRSSAVVLIGPRQCGKTTLARELVSLELINYFDLEDPVSVARLEQPMTELAGLEGLVVIDEIQRPARIKNCETNIVLNLV